MEMLHWIITAIGVSAVWMLVGCKPYLDLCEEDFYAMKPREAFRLLFSLGPILWVSFSIYLAWQLVAWIGEWLFLIVGGCVITVVEICQALGKAFSRRGK